jgi:hypothetical protein
MPWMERLQSEKTQAEKIQAESPPALDSRVRDEVG